MGMGYSACKTTTITETELDKVVATELKAFNDYLAEISVEKNARLGRDLESGCVSDSLDEFDDDLDVEAIAEKISELASAVCEAFEKSTGVSLYPSGHDSEEHGSSYDDVDGFFWELSVYQLTPEAKALQEKGIKFEDAHYVTYG